VNQPRSDFPKLPNSVTRPILALFLSSVAHGQLLPGVDPRLPEAGPVESLPPVHAAESGVAGTGAVLCDELREIRLESETGGELPSSAALGEKLEKWRGKALREGDLVAMADEILAHYDAAGYPVVAVDAPDQDLKSGVLRLVIGIGKIGKVAVTRPKYGDPEAITRGLWLRGGEELRREEIDAQLAWYGRGIFRKPELFVSPGELPGTADLLIGLEETRLWRATLGYENSGPDLLGSDRFIVGAAGMTPGEQVVAWQTVVGAPVSSLHAHALSWEIPFHRSHQSLLLEAAYAEVMTSSVSGGFPVENSGTSWSFAALQKLPLPALGKWRQRFESGIEVKATDQFVLFGGGNFSPGEVRLVNGKVLYGLGRDWEDGGFSMEASLLGSPGGLVSGNNDEDFRAYDAAADASYSIGRLGAQGWWSPGEDWKIALRGAAQATDSRLLPAEQFAAGGYQTVRGVEEREYFADNGWQSSLELYGPQIAVGGIYQVRLLGFFDQAWLKSRGEASDWISGAGFGVRMKLTDHADLRADQGWRLDEPGSQTHVGLMLTF
jgi:hemolysin activation/secretion protein